MKTQYNTANKTALEIYLPQYPVLTVVSCKFLTVLNKYRFYLGPIQSVKTENLYQTRIGTRLGSVLVLGDEVVQVLPIQSFGAKQNCSSKHLKPNQYRSWIGTNPSSKQPIRKNSIFLNYPNESSDPKGL